jgi:hypothetical protein
MKLPEDGTKYGLNHGNAPKRRIYRTLYFGQQIMQKYKQIIKLEGDIGMCRMCNVTASPRQHCSITGSGL